ncbi:hypothetical protein TD95_003810 [Thielaviopsis punctulata]|uniref:Beta-xylanase n=1 Tax=Thielaviopsis punctulata TaxID=72032 RepID=A0A0F4ZBJ5_9PEZI|nr:hypothetical protein TD95_003810 [Thielaviopsis punctulata]
MLPSIASIVALAGFAAAETVYGVSVFSRHGDRTAKHYNNQYLTKLGAHEVFSVGTGFRERYLLADSAHQIAGISPDVYDASQIYASAPDASILLGTANYFLQGLYPPLDDTDAAAAASTLANGTNVTAPLAGYQYVTLHAEDEDAPEYVWIKGDDECPALTTAVDAWKDSTVYAERVDQTKDFYESLFPAFSDVYDITSPSQLSYTDAYDLFDLINVARIHNASSPAANVTAAQFLQLRTLADSAEFDANFNASNAASYIHAKTLAAGFLNQLNTIVAGKGKLKFSLFAGSYDTMLAFFGLTKLTEVSTNFYGLPDYASTMAFELFTADNTTAFPDDADSDLRVRFLFRNGTQGTLTAFPVFGTNEESLSWGEFKTHMNALAITSAKDWCSACGSTKIFCLGYTEEAKQASSSKGKSGMSNAVAGVIGALVTLGVFVLAGVVAFFLFRGKKGSTDSVHSSLAEKTRVSVESRCPPLFLISLTRSPNNSSFLCIDIPTMRTSLLIASFGLGPAAAQLNTLARAAGLEYFGTAVDVNYFGDSAYMGLVEDTSLIGSLVPENSMKWDATEPSRGVFSYNNGDQVQSLAARDGQLLRCHTLTWHSQLPSWVSSGTWSYDELKSIIETHIANVVGHYRGKCHHWDVVNEAADDSGAWRASIFYNTMGTDYLPISFKAARAADPNAKLYYNDYNLEYNAAKTDRVYEAVQIIQAANAPIDGVGFQGHLVVGTTPSRSSLATVLRRFTSLGVEVAYTELDIRHSSLPANASASAQQGVDFANVVGSCLDVDGCVGVTVWGLSSKYSWVESTFPGEGDACLYDDDLAQKPAWTSVSAVLAAEATARAIAEKTLKAVAARATDC